MPTSFLPYEPNQDFLLPPSVSEWLPENHLAYFVSETVDRLDLQKFYARYDGDGRRNQPYDPAMLAKVLVYGYSTGVFSSRKLARKLYEDIAFRFLAAGNFPSHRTICDFRVRHLSEFVDLLVQVGQLARELGLVKLGTIALDGTKVHANASKHKAMSYGRMKQQEQEFKQQIEALLERARAVDVQEDARSGGVKPKRICLRSSNGVRIVWLRLRRQKNAWRQGKPKPIESEGVIPMMSSAQEMEPGGLLSVPSGCPMTKPRTILPIPNRAL